jgi:dTMP kinase
VSPFFGFATQKLGQLVEQKDALPELGRSTPNEFGVFITFEGIEAAGKSTLIAGLDGDLRLRGENVLVTREPGGTPLGDRIRQISNDPATVIDPLAEALLISASRAQHVAEVIVPALRRGQTILCDRFFDSTIAYQGYGRGLDIEMLLGLQMTATSRIAPDLTLLLDIPAELSLARVRARGAADRFEREEADFHERVRAGYHQLAQRFSQRYVIVDASRAAAAVQADALAIITERRAVHAHR